MCKLQKLKENGLDEVRTYRIAAASMRTAWPECVVMEEQSNTILGISHSCRCEVAVFSALFWMLDLEAGGMCNPVDYSQIQYRPVAQ